jgi:hypothetical protein
MPDALLPVSPDTLLGFGFDVATVEAAAQETAELAEAVFGPFDPEVAEGWALSAAQDLSPADLRELLAEAATAPDPLAFLAPFRRARAMLDRRMRWRWSSLRARALGHPPGLRGRIWFSLSEAARAEVRENLKELSDFEDTRVPRHRPRREDLDTFLRELARIYARYTHYPRHEIGLDSNPDSRFIELASRVLEGLPPMEDGQPRLSRNLRSVKGLASRWQRIKEHHQTGVPE